MFPQGLGDDHEDFDLSIVKQERLDEMNADSYGLQSFASTSGEATMPIGTSSEKNEIGDVAEVKQEPKDSDNSEDSELKELQKENNKKKRIKNSLISQNISIFQYAKSCPNCKKSFNSSLTKKKIIHFKSCCNSKRRWVEEQELVIMIEDLKYKFKPEMEKRKRDDIDYDSSEEVSKDPETRKIYHYFSIEKSNIGNKKNVDDNLMKNEKDLNEFPSDNHKSLKKKSVTKKIKVEADDGKKEKRFSE